MIKWSLTNPKNSTKNSSQIIPLKKIFLNWKIPPKKFPPKSQKSPQKILKISKKILRFWKYPIPYIALSGRKPFWASISKKLFFNNSDSIAGKLLGNELVMPELWKKRHENFEKYFFEKLSQIENTASDFLRASN
mgnify:CR=1 FL=1